MTGGELAQHLGTQGFPNPALLASNSDYIASLPGYLPADQFLEALQLIGTEMSVRWS